MELEVGMYVRTDNGIIGKIYEQIGDMFTYKDSNRDYITYGLSHNEILKASYNIIDILEEGDYVSTITGECAVIIGVYHDINGKKYIRLCNCIGDYYEDDIKSVITHEQMKQMAYKVGE